VILGWHRCLAHRLSPLLALVAVVAWPVGVCPAAADPGVALAQARAAAARGDRDGAIAGLEQAVTQDPGLALAYRWLSRLYTEKGLREKAIDDAAAAALISRDPDDEKYLARLLAAGPPDSMARRDADAIPLEKSPITVEPLDDRAAGCPRSGRGACQALLIVTDQLDHPAIDPRFDWQFDRACYGYLLDRPTDRWVLTVVEHHNSSGSETRRELGVTCAGILLRAACACLGYLGASSQPQKALHLWIADGGKPGAESWGPDIYLFAAATAREPAEWVRELLHEYGHAALPGVDHFVEPEPWANGRLGEQLLSRWLAMARVSPGHDWLSAERLAPLRAEADRCLGLFLEQGPASPLLTDRSTKGMDFYLGFANYVERAFGGRMLANAMRLSAGNGSRGFAVGVQEALRRDLPAGVELRAVQTESRAVTHWMYLPAGTICASCRGCEAEVRFNGRTIGKTESDLGGIAEGWHAIRLPAGAAVTFRAAAPANP